MTSDADPPPDDAVDRLIAQRDVLDVEAFLGSQYDRGLAWPHFRRQCGGSGVDSEASRALRRRILEAGAPQSPASFVGLYQASALLHEAGSDEQRDRYLRRIFTGEDQWCQLFSEPGAGSDLANVGTQAVRVGSEWRIDGQKVWTSNARHANVGLLLARTDPLLPKHRGMTLFIIDMRDPGVEVRPLRQADGGLRFSEVFLSDVRVDDDQRLGSEGEGWALSVSTLSNERESASDIFRVPIERLLEPWGETKRWRHPALRDAVVGAWVDSFLLDVSRIRQRLTTDPQEAAALRSIAKIAASEHLQRMSATLAEVIGPDVLVHADYDAAGAEDLRRESAKAKDFATLGPHRFVLRSRAMSIEGGTNEIARNIVGERVLGLPSDIRVDKAGPWKETARS
jgi:alkylation response protein AidB-like acyl-CoA dehydrogenase